MLKYDNYVRIQLFECPHLVYFYFYSVNAFLFCDLLVW